MLICTLVLMHLYPHLCSQLHSNTHFHMLTSSLSFSHSQARSSCTPTLISTHAYKPTPTLILKLISPLILHTYKCAHIHAHSFSHILILSQLHNCSYPHTLMHDSLSHAHSQACTFSVHKLTLFSYAHINNQCPQVKALLRMHSQGVPLLLRPGAGADGLTRNGT